MFGLKKSSLKADKHNQVEPECSVTPGGNPFDSNDELDNNKQAFKPPRKASSEPNLNMPNSCTNPFEDEGDERGISSSSSAARERYKNDFCDSGGLENQSVQELENYAVYKAEETTKAVNGCVKIANEIREDATNTLITLHQQGQQITRTHDVAVDIDQDLSRGEKLLGNLGGMFSRTWKPKKTCPITGPTFTKDDSSNSRFRHLEQREKFGLNPVHKEQSKERTPRPEPNNALEKVEVEKAKQDDALSDLSDMLGELKNMATDMGNELDRHTEALEPVQNDIDELAFRVKGAKQRGRRLLGK